MAEHRACALDEISKETPKVVRLEGVPILLCRLDDDDVRAFENKCTHADLPLHKGPWDPRAGEITCPAHHAVFGVRDGAVRVGPAVVPLELFPVRKVEDAGRTWIHVAVPEED